MKTQLEDLRFQRLHNKMELVKAALLNGPSAEDPELVTIGAAPIPRQLQIASAVRHNKGMNHEQRNTQPLPLNEGGASHGRHARIVDQPSYASEGFKAAVKKQEPSPRQKGQSGKRYEDEENAVGKQRRKKEKRAVR